MRSRRRPVVCVAITTTVFLLSSCSPIQRAAVTLDPRGDRPVLLLGLCDGEGVAEVTLRPFELDEGVYRALPPIWRIEASQPRMVSRFTPGDVPAGFDELIPFKAGGLGGQLRLYALVGLGAHQRPHQETFLLRELRSDAVQYNGHTMRSREFGKEATAACTTNPLDDYGLSAGTQRALVSALGLALLTALGLAGRSWSRRRSRGRAMAR